MMLLPFTVSLFEDPESVETIVFQCEAEDWNHAAEQAENAYPRGMIQSISLSQ